MLLLFPIRIIVEHFGHSALAPSETGIFGEVHFLHRSAAEHLDDSVSPANDIG